MAVDDTRTGTWVTYADGSPESLRIRRCRLVVISGPDKGKTTDLSSSRIRVGAQEGCDLVLSDRLVSRYHFEIALDRNGYCLRDLDSTNGTYLSGHRIREAYLNRGSVIYTGESRLRFEPLDDSVSVELSQQTQFGDLLGSSAVMRALFAQLEKIAPTDANILVTGETGTGKELVAEAIHRNSPRARGPFVVVDCGSLPENLIGSELFGHERGAFTGAVASYPGAFERASGGTVFLDELGELPLELQTNLLGVLERRQVRRLGGKLPTPVDIRVIAATNRDLGVEINRGRFREDLYYRLAVVEVHVPPLRERSEDIPALATHFLTLFSGDEGASLSERVLEKLKRHPFPGNVRELKNLMERSVVLSGSSLDQTPPLLASAATAPSQPEADSDDLVSFAVDEQVPYKAARDQLLRKFEIRYLRKLLMRHAGNISRAARAARIDRMTIHNMMQRTGLSRDRE